MGIRIFFLGAVLFCFIIVNQAFAEVLRYKDDDGRVHYVESIEKVPQQYRSQLKDAPPLPSITKIPSATFTDKYKAKSQGANRKSGQSGGGDWQQKYSDCMTLASVMNKEPSPFFKPPHCERIPKLCSKNAASPECVAELSRYYRK